MSLLNAAIGGFLIGLLVFLLLPFVGAATGWRGPAKAMMLLATMPIRRFAVVVSESNDIVDKTMSYDALGFERITLDSTPKTFSDPANRLHNWLGLRFALADEETGTLFDPRDAAIGREKRRFDERNERAFAATNDEWDDYGIEKWVPGAFTLPDSHQLVDLSAASELVTGGERSEYPKRVKSLYEHAMAALHGGKSLADLLRLSLPVIAFFAVFGGIWFMASQFGTPGGSGGGSVVSFGGAMLAAIVTDRRAAAKKVAGVLLALLLAAGGVMAAFMLWGLFLAIVAAFTFIVGFLFLPVVAQIGRLHAGLGGMFTSAFFRLAFASYRQPVLLWTPKQYELVEYDDLEDTAPEPEWYALFGSDIGFTFEPGPEAFGEAGVSVDELDAYTEQTAVADGGEVESNLPPARYDKAPSLAPDRYGGFVPADRQGYGVLADIAMGWWKGSADGAKSQRQLLQAKEEFGGDEPPVADKTLLYLTAVMGALGGALGIVIFLL